MSHMSSSANAAGDVEISPPFASSAVQAQYRPSWWRSLWFRQESKVADIRALMLAQLMADQDDARRAALAARIATAEHAEALWSLRQDWMQALTAVHGDMLARRRLTDISFMFAGLLHRQWHADADAGGLGAAGSWQTAPAPGEHLRTGH